VGAHASNQSVQVGYGNHRDIRAECLITTRAIAAEGDEAGPRSRKLVVSGSSAKTRLQAHADRHHRITAGKNLESAGIGTTYRSRLRSLAEHGDHSRSARVGGRDRWPRSFRFGVGLGRQHSCHSSRAWAIYWKTVLHRQSARGDLRTLLDLSAFEGCCAGSRQGTLFGTDRDRRARSASFYERQAGAGGETGSGLRLSGRSAARFQRPPTTEARFGGCFAS